jgi:hypothetical protein
LNKSENKKKKRLIFHPFLVALFPILAIYSQNIGRVELQDLVLPIALLLIFSAGSYYLLKIILKNPFKAALIVTIILICLFSYGHVYYLLNDVSINGFDIGRNMVLIPVFGLMLSISIFFAIKEKRVFDNTTSILNIVSIVLVIMAFSNLILVAAEITSCDKCANQELFFETKDFSYYFEPHKFSISENQVLPDVYYLILDEYARNDALLEYHNFDNSEFTEFLENLGFHVAKNSFGNYPMSIQSIPATMNMDYINFLADEIGPEVRNYKPLGDKDYGLYPNNMVIKNFKEMGYNIITFNTFGLHLHQIPLADEAFCTREKYVLDNRLVDTLARTSIFGYYVERWGEAEIRQVTLCAFEKFASSGKVFDKPVFVWAHIMLPHPPWIFGPNGEEITPGKPLLLTDNPEFRDSGWEPKLQYIQQVQFANKKTIEVVENILEHDKNSIIIIQGDHGTAWGGILKPDPTKEDVVQRLRNFDAIYFPDEEKRDQLKDERTLVNTFRTVFNSYFGSDYEILEDRMYWGWNEKPYSFDEVTHFLTDFN